MTEDLKDILKRYLQSGRDALLWKLDGLSERQARLPLTGTGTNVLGLVKHLAGVELGYFRVAFGHPVDLDLPWFAEDADDNADMWATAEESLDSIAALYRHVWTLSDATIDSLALTDGGVVPWWGPEPVSLQRILIHVIAETHRHAGQVDIVREQLDGLRGLRLGGANLPPGDAQWWADYVGRLRAVAESFPE